MIQFLSILGGLATQWVQGKSDEAKAKQDVKLKAMQSEENWEKMMAEGSKNSWKDEWFVVVLSIPMIGSFIPSLVPYIQQGFAVLDTMPEYYKGFLAAAIAASFGLKGLANWKK
jgi:hypothetical protein